MEVYRYESIAQVEPEKWNSLVKENHLLHSYEYLKAVEYSKINDFKYNYFVFCQGSKIVAIAPVGILQFGLDAMASPFVKKIIDFIRKFFPSFLQVKFIESGFCSALGNSILIEDKQYLKEVLDVFDKELTALAHKEKSKFIVVRDIYSQEKNDYDYFFQLHYNLIQNLPNVLFRVMYNTYDEYMNDLNSKRRHEISYRFKIFYDSGCTIREVYDFKSLAPTIIRLWMETYNRAKEGQREILNKEYFEYMAEFVQKKAFILLCEKQGKPIGFTMLLDCGETLISTYCGMDYEVNKDCFTYFVLFYKSIEKAIEMKKKWLELGISSYTPKIELGGIPEPLYIYLKSTNRVFNKILGPILEWTSVSPCFEVRNIFNNKHYKKLNFSQIYAEIDEQSFPVTDVDMKSFTIEIQNSATLSKLAKQKQTPVKIFCANEFTIFLTATAKTSFAKNLHFQIDSLCTEYFLRWNEIAKYYSSIQ